jgi:acyl carrier protein
MADDPRTIILEVLAGIAPEADLAAVSPQANLRQELDLDSVDFQNFLIGVAKRAGIDVPDRDAASLTTLAACEAYVRGRA